MAASSPTVSLTDRRALIVRPQLATAAKEYADVGGFAFSEDNQHIYFSVSLAAGKHQIMRVNVAELDGSMRGEGEGQGTNVSREHHEYPKEMLVLTMAYGRDISCLSDGRLALIEAGRQNTASGMDCPCGCSQTNVQRYSIALFLILRLNKIKGIAITIGILFREA